MEYKHLIEDEALQERWVNSFSNELGRLAQGRRSTNLYGTNTIFFTEYQNIPLDRRKDITYGRIVVDYRPQKNINTGIFSIKRNTLNSPHIELTQKDT